MPLTRIDRLIMHKKQETMAVKTSIPNVNEMKEGIPVLIYLNNEGLFHYVKYGGNLYRVRLERV